VPEFHRNASLEDAILSLRKEEDRKDHQDQAAFEREAKEARIKRRGAKEALEQLAVRFGNTLFDNVPKLKECIEEPLKQAFYGGPPLAFTRRMVSNLFQVIYLSISVIQRTC